MKSKSVLNNHRAENTYHIQKMNNLSNEVIDEQDQRLEQQQEQIDEQQVRLEIDVIVNLKT